MKNAKRLRVFGLSSVLVSAVVGAGACGSSTNNEAVGGGGAFPSGTGQGAGHEGSGNGSGSGQGGKSGSSSSGMFVGSSVSTQSGGTGAASAGLDVTPTAQQTLSVPIGAHKPTQKYEATVNGEPKSVGWSVDQGAIGTVDPGPSQSAVFTPSGTIGGLVDVIAGYGGKTVTRKILVKLSGTQNGLDATNPEEQKQIAGGVADLSAGGGVGGVGGEGLGGAVSMTLQHALTHPSGNGSAQKLSLLYPYDATVWPRGMLAPLLQWSWDLNDADAIEIKVETSSGSFSWTGTFGRPAILATTLGPFVRHPIPQDIWDMATNTAGGPTANGKPDLLTVSLTVAKDGKAYGPISETWSVAPGRLTGTVYYNSYGTQLVKNWASPDHQGNRVGAAILGVRSGDTAPTLVVGENSTDDSGCRVCHVVSSRGRWLLTQSEQGTPGDGQSYLYDLTAANVQGSSVTLAQQGTFAWAALTGDASFALTNTIDPSSSNPAITNSAANGAVSSFWQFGPAPTPATLTGLPDMVSAGYPSYSPDDKLVAWIDVPGVQSTAQGPIKVAQYDATNHTFSNVQTIYTPPATTDTFPQAVSKAGYPVFLPDDSGMLFEHQIRHGSDNVIATRNGARSELWWVTLGANPKATALANLNGKKPNGKPYLPLGPNNHGASTATDPEDSLDESTFDDTTLNYEPTVLPVVAGGYAWVVFTSRRMYGNELQSVPYQSWPPDYDTTSLAQATVKKLWVAAIDLSAPAGSDVSHPAFYLPAQELLAGNSRGFWVLDPCKPDGTSCETGDQCCNGYCETSGDAGGLVCSNKPPNATCSGVQEKCTTAADCCDSTNLCINGFCAQGAPPH